MLPEAVVHMRFSPCASRESSVLRVLTVCRMIYIEAFHIFYRQNDLEFSNPYALFHFLSSLNPKRRFEITAISVSNFGLHYSSAQLAPKAFSLLLLCPRLQSFRLDMSLHLKWQLKGNYSLQADLLVNREGLNVRDMSDIRAAFDVLMNLRGLTRVNIRGIHPDHWVGTPLDYWHQLSELEEVNGPFESLLKATWMGPKSQSVETRVNRALANLARSRVNGLAQEI